MKKTVQTNYFYIVIGISIFVIVSAFIASRYIIEVPAGKMYTESNTEMYNEYEAIKNKLVAGKPKPITSYTRYDFGHLALRLEGEYFQVEAVMIPFTINEYKFTDEDCKKLGKFALNGNSDIIIQERILKIRLKPQFHKIGEKKQAGFQGRDYYWDAMTYEEDSISAEELLDKKLKRIKDGPEGDGLYAMYIVYPIKSVFSARFRNVQALMNEYPNKPFGDSNFYDRTYVNTNIWARLKIGEKICNAIPMP
ncbi:MAG: hypothetical protein J4473_01705 [Candidatus Aenigmarchaeota archaeon]|nr:hypothetical protein [Candidatus Aenigmarchaeota archaeon]